MALAINFNEGPMKDGKKEKQLEVTKAKPPHEVTSDLASDMMGVLESGCMSDVVLRGEGFER